MPEISPDFSPANFVNAIEANLFSWIPVFHQVWGLPGEPLTCLQRSISHIPVPLFNSIMDAQLSSDNANKTIRAICEDAKNRRVPVLWWVGPSTLPEDLADRLLSNGFTIDEDGSGMAVLLADLDEKLPFPPGLFIRQAVDETSQHIWCQTMAEGFEIRASKRDFAINSWYELICQVSPGTTQIYTAWLNGDPVATSLLQLGGGVAGIYAVATIPEARRKGIGAQVTLSPLLQARNLGYKVGVLEASSMGEPVYRSLGFQKYCRITSYRWSSG
jgi:GNAT superfamily N-acetyltransferase